MSKLTNLKKSMSTKKIPTTQQFNNKTISESKAKDFLHKNNTEIVNKYA